jgi:hypothetical protein
MSDSFYQEIKNRNEKKSLDDIIKEQMLRAAILKRDLTKRQLKIVYFIYLYSFGFAKEWALIPKMRDFELCGISKIKIRQEINTLVDYNMIEENQEEHLFRLKCPSEWKAPFHDGFSLERKKELVRINMQHAKENE